MGSLDDRAHGNVVHFTRFLAELEDGAHLLERDGAVAYAGPVDWPSSRMAVRDDDGAGPEAWADTVEGFFARHGRTGCVFARVGRDDDLTDVLTRRGWAEYSQTPEMVCDAPRPEREPPEGVVSRFAATPSDVLAYAAVAGQAFRHLGMPQDGVRDALSNPGRLLRPDVAIAVAEIDGEIVAGALVLLVGGGTDGYIGWVSVADAARGRTLGDVVTRRVTNEAFARGAEIATLEASHFGESTYARMGYRELYRYRILIKA